MFFVVSKVIAFVASPFVWFCLLAIMAIAIKKWRLRLSVVAAIVFIIFSNQAIFKWTIDKWEDDLETIAAFQHSKRPIVVLGGYCTFDSLLLRTRFNQSSDRLMQALIARQGNTERTIILAGGASNIYRAERGEGAAVKDALVKIGINTKNIWVDSLSRNTFENAVETQRLFNQKGWTKRIILSTSAWHMPRAKRCFELQGFDVIPMNTDHLTPISPLAWHHYIIPSAATFTSWDLLMREWIGMVAYRIKGYI